MMTLAHTQRQVILSITIVTSNDTGLYLAVVPLLSLGWLIMALWRFRLAAYRAGFWLKQAHSAAWRVSEAMRERLTIAAKLLTIGFNSLAWGCL